jgi:Heterokaryon incompatibility protein (HET)
MLNNGWCRKRLNFVESIRMFYPAFYFMSSFRPPQRKNEDHQSCTPAKCYVTTGLVEPFHRTDDCQCQDVHVPLEQVLRIVAAGGIPLIRIGRSPSEEFGLEVVPYIRTIRFTAISHVWADRQLGSTKNALPRCQVEYLDSMLAAIPRKIEDWRLCDWLPKRSPTPGPIEPPSRTYEYFWLDTFCIPQDLQHADLKHKAIGSMNLIYAAATQTLVFDSGLQKFNARQRPSSLAHGGRPTFYAPTDKNLLDVLAHLCASNWMGRAW